MLVPVVGVYGGGVFKKARKEEYTRSFCRRGLLTLEGDTSGKGGHVGAGGV